MAADHGASDANYTLFDPPPPQVGEPGVHVTPARPDQGGARIPRTTSGVSHEAIVTFLALASVKGMGSASMRALCATFRPLDRIWEAGPAAAEHALKEAKNRQADAVIQRLWMDRTTLMEQADGMRAALEREDVRVVLQGDVRYPGRLLDLEQPPAWLYVMGSVDVLHRMSTVAVVGTREPTPAGRATARRATHALVDAGFVVVSGLAEGIDQEVHQAVLQRGGETVAVLGNGLGIEFPAGSNALRRQIVDQGGAVVTEHLPSESYSRRSFIERNRIQAAISAAVLPVQGARKSGTAHTIRYAQELGRLLLGAWATRPTPTPENELLEWLAELDATVYDVSSAAGLSALVAALAPFAADAKPPHRDPVTERRKAYGAAIRMLGEALTRRPPSEDDARWLREGIQQMIQTAQGTPARATQPLAEQETDPDGASSTDTPA